MGNRSIGLLAVLTAVLSVLGLVEVRATEGQPDLGRPFTVHVPAGLDVDDAGAVPLVVALHGCGQDGGKFPVGTRFADVADEAGFVVVFPEQLRSANASACWNWFLPDHQSRGAGEPEILAAITEHVIADTTTVDNAGEAVGLIDRDRVFVTGLSAGADMATVMAATYPDLYAAVAPIAGCAYLTCADVAGEAAIAAMGDHARPMPAFVVQSTGDEVNNVAMGETAVQQWKRTYELALGASTGQPALAHRAFVPGGDGDLCVEPGSQYPCPAGALGWAEYPVTSRTWADPTNGCVATLAWTVHLAGHAWLGGDADGAYTEGAGPDLSRAIWSFFDDSVDCRT